MPGRSIDCRCPMTLYFRMHLVGEYFKSWTQDWFEPQKAQYFIFDIDTILSYWARQRHTLSLTTPPSLSNIWNFHKSPPTILPTVSRVLFNELGVFYFFFSQVPRVSFITRVSFGCHCVIFWGYLPWVSFITRVLFIGESRVIVV